MAENFIRLPQDEAGKRVRTISSIITENEVHSNVIAVTDSSGDVIAPKRMGFISSVNSSTTPLNNTETFTGEWEDVGNYDSVVVSLATDVSHTYYIQFSPDGTNQDSSLTRYHKTNEINVPHRFTITRQYCRVVVTNTSGSNASYMRLQTSYGDKQPLNVPLDGTVSQDYDATIVRNTDFKHEVGLGLRRGVTNWSKFGYNLDVDSSAPEVIAAFGGTFTPLTTAGQLSIQGSDTADTNAGTGAKQIRITGIDENRDYQQIIASTTGVSSFVTQSSWYGVNRMDVYDSGSGKTNAGSIVATTLSSIQAIIPAGEGITQQCIYHTPRNHRALGTWLHLNVVKSGGPQNPSVATQGYVFDPILNTKREVFRADVDTAVESTVDITPGNPFSLGEGNVLWFEATTDKDNTKINLRFDVVEYKNVDA